MKAFVITLANNSYSEAKAERCIRTAKEIGGLNVQCFGAVDKEAAQITLKIHGLRWTWAKGNTADDVCPFTGLKQRPYGALLPKMGCALSHYCLWLRCIRDEEPFLILEHDAVFDRKFEPFEFRGICQINDPKGATPRGQWWSEQMAKRGPGVFEKTCIFPDDVPDGLAGNSAYVIKPHAAQKAVENVREIGLWPNDALMCRQLFDLQELYPFVTHVEQEVSTSS